jgi:RNA polymerase sigma-70 factor (ECF subfamily)
MPPEIDDLTLAHSAQRGDLDVFNLIVDRYQSLLFRIAMRMLGDEDNAADACQLAWIAAFRNLNTFRGGRLQSWLVRVLLNTCYDEIRRRHRRREVPLLPLNDDGEEAETGSWLVDRAASVEDAVDSREFEIAIHKGLQSLLPVYRTMLVLVDIEGMSYEEAAAAAHVPMGTVRSRLARARMALRQRLQETADLAPAPHGYQAIPPVETRLRTQ